MPRRHRYQQHVRFTFPKGEKGKTRYPNKEAAEKAAEIRMLQNPGLELTVYQGIDKGWYLTRNQEPERFATM